MAGVGTWCCRSWGLAPLEGNSSGARVVHGPKDAFHPQGEIQQCDVPEASCGELC